MASLYRKPVMVTDAATGNKVKRKSKKWWAQYKDVEMEQPDESRIEAVPHSVCGFAADLESPQAEPGSCIRLYRL